MKKKRNLMAGLAEGFFVALADQRTGKRTLRTHIVQTKATPKMSAKELSALRERMKILSPGVICKISADQWYVLSKTGSKGGPVLTRKQHY